MGVSLLAAGCGGGSGSGSVGVGGTVSGLGPGLAVVLQDDGTDMLSVQVDGPFVFPVAVEPGGVYDVEVAQQPAGQVCVVQNGQGVIPDSGGAPGITVTCGSDVSVGGAVSGLAPGTSVTLSDGDVLLPVAANGDFAFPGVLPAGSAFDVEVSVQPAGEVCSVLNGQGTVQAGVMAITTVTCRPD
jgi:hypothetical protein